MANKHNGWDKQEIAKLVQLFQDGNNVRQVAVEIDRDEDDVAKMRQRILNLKPRSLPKLKRQHKSTALILEVLG